MVDRHGKQEADRSIRFLHQRDWGGQLCFAAVTGDFQCRPSHGLGENVHSERPVIGGQWFDEADDGMDVGWGRRGRGGTRDLGANRAEHLVNVRRRHLLHVSDTTDLRMAHIQMQGGDVVAELLVSDRFRGEEQSAPAPQNIEAVLQPFVDEGGDVVGQGGKTSFVFAPALLAQSQEGPSRGQQHRQQRGDQRQTIGPQAGIGHTGGDGGLSRPQGKQRAGAQLES